MNKKNGIFVVSLGLSVMLSGVSVGLGVAGATSGIGGIGGIAANNATGASAPPASVTSSTYPAQEGSALAQQESLNPLPSSVPSPSPATPTFTDLADHWAKATIERAVQLGYVDGYEDATFRPDQSVSRAEFIKLVIAALHLDTGSSKVAGDDWYAPYVQAATTAKLYVDGEYATGDLNSAMSRFEMTRIMVRSLDPSFQSGDKATDDDAIMYKATQLGLIQGMDDQGTLAGDQPMTRAQAVTIVERLLAAKKGAKLPVDQNAVNQASMAELHNNFSAFGATPAVTLPFSFTVDGVKYTLHDMYIYTLDDPIAQDIVKKYDLYTNTTRNPSKYLVWCKITIRNVSDTMEGRYFDDYVSRWELSIKDYIASISPTSSKDFEREKTYNSTDLLNAYEIDPGQKLDTYEAYVIPETSFKGMAFETRDGKLYYLTTK